MISLICAIGENLEISYDGQLIWRIKEDLRHFKAVTTGHPVIMGRKTWETLPGALPGRMNIVITRTEGYQAEGAVVVHSVDDALKVASGAKGSDEIFIMGGGEIYAQTISKADRLYLTDIHATCKGADAYFPPIDTDRVWTTVEEGDIKQNGDITFSFRVLERGNVDGTDIG